MCNLHHLLTANTEEALFRIAAALEDLKELKELELKRKNQAKEQKAPKSLPSHLEQSFERFWSNYPLKVKKATARAAWLRISPSPKMAHDIIDALIAQRGTEEWLKKDGKYVPHPTSWLNQRRFEDERPKKTTPTPTAPGPEETKQFLKEETQTNGKNAAE